MYNMAVEEIVFLIFLQNDYKFTWRYGILIIFSTWKNIDVENWFPKLWIYAINTFDRNTLHKNISCFSAFKKGAPKWRDVKGSYLFHTHGKMWWWWSDDGDLMWRIAFSNIDVIRLTLLTKKKKYGW